MNAEIVLDNLQKRNNSLKSQLIHNQLKYGVYPFDCSRKYTLIILNEYKKHRSFFKVSSIVGITQNEIMDWYIQGQMGNPRFRGFFLAVNEINKCRNEGIDDEQVQESEINIAQDKGHVISEYGDGWSYKAFIDGEKVFIISKDLETLKKKVRDRHLPLD